MRRGKSSLLIVGICLLLICLILFSRSVEYIGFGENESAINYFRSDGLPTWIFIPKKDSDIIVAYKIHNKGILPYKSKILLKINGVVVSEKNVFVKPLSTKIIYVYKISRKDLRNYEKNCESIRVCFTHLYLGERYCTYDYRYRSFYPYSLYSYFYITIEVETRYYYIMRESKETHMLFKCGLLNVTRKWI